jgi:valyl-tRNA synthetase
MNLDGKKPEADVSEAQGLANKWILHRLEEVKANMSEVITGYRFNEAAQSMYGFIWHEFCDWYLEMIKPDLYSDDEKRKEATLAVLWTVLSETMVLLHPIMPFVTQEIWSVLPGVDAEDISTVAYPEKREACLDAATVEKMELFQGIVASVRNIRTELQVAPSKKLDLLVRTADEHSLDILNENMELIKFLARLENVECGPDVKGPKASGTYMSNSIPAQQYMIP